MKSTIQTTSQKPETRRNGNLSVSDASHKSEEFEVFFPTKVPDLFSNDSLVANQNFITGGCFKGQCEMNHFVKKPDPEFMAYEMKQSPCNRISFSSVII